MAVGEVGYVCTVQCRSLGADVWKGLMKFTTRLLREVTSMSILPETKCYTRVELNSTEIVAHDVTSLFCNCVSAAMRVPCLVSSTQQASIVPVPVV